MLEYQQHETRRIARATAAQRVTEESALPVVSKQRDVHAISKDVAAAQRDGTPSHCVRFSQFDLDITVDASAQRVQAVGSSTSNRSYHQYSGTCTLHDI